MSVTREELDSFHGYAVAKVSNGGTNLSWADLFELWRMENPTEAERAEMQEIFREAIQDFEAGRGIPVDEAMAELRRKYGLPQK